MEHSKKALELFLSGCNCSQAVFAAFSDITGLDLESSKKVSFALGGGISRTRNVCGAVLGMLMVIGCVDKTNDKKHIYQLGQELMNKFKDINGSYICGELLNSNDTNPTPQKRDEKYYQKRPCTMLVESAAKILDEYLCEVEK